MPISLLNRVRGGASRAFDSEVLAWESAVAANGGSLTLARRIIVDQLFYDLKAAGVWAKTTDLGLLACENAPQGLTSLKGRVLGTGVNTPTWNANQDFTTDGAASYINTNVTPVSTNEGFLGYWERVNTTVSTGGYAIGTRNNSTQSVALRPKSGTQAMTCGFHSSSDVTLSLPTNSSKGFTLVNRTASPVFEGFKDGTTLGTGTPVTVTSTAIGYPVMIGGYSNAGTLATPRGSSGSFWILGATALSPAEQLALYNAVLAALTSIGTTL